MRSAYSVSKPVSWKRFFRSLTALNLVALGLVGCPGEHTISLKDSQVASDGKPSGDLLQPTLDYHLRDQLQDTFTPSSSVQYFGYAFSGPFVEELKDHTNIVHVSSDYTGSSDLSQMAQARQAGLKVALDLVAVFFPRGCADFDLQRVSNSTRWASYAQRLVPYQDVLAMFYPVDEPYWNCGPTNGQLSLVQVEEVLQLVNQQIKASFPAIPIAMVFAFPSVNDSLIIPRGVDWVGFDCYDGFEACPDPNLPSATLGYPSRSVPEYLDILRQKKSPEQRLLLVPPAYPGYLGDQALSEEKIIDILDKYIDLAQKDSEVVAILGFIWPDFGLTPGARSLPRVAHRYREIGAQLLHKGSPPALPLPASSTPELLFVGKDGTPKNQFNIDTEDLTGIIRGGSPDQTYWCLTIENKGDCKDLILGSAFNLVSATDPAWQRDLASGEWRLSLPNPLLNNLPQGLYGIHCYDASLQQRSKPWMFRLTRPPRATASATLGGPAQGIFSRSSHTLFIRVEFPLIKGLWQCAAFGAENKCTVDRLRDPDVWGAITGDGDGWTFDELNKQWNVQVPQADLAGLPNGDYTLHYLDSNSYLSQAIVIQLVD